LGSRGQCFSDRGLLLIFLTANLSIIIVPTMSNIRRLRVTDRIFFVTVSFAAVPKILTPPNTP
jgi:hypothetical protein